MNTMSGVESRCRVDFKEGSFPRPIISPMAKILTKALQVHNIIRKRLPYSLISYYDKVIIVLFKFGT